MADMTVWVACHGRCRYFGDVSLLMTLFGVHVTAYTTSWVRQDCLATDLQCGLVVSIDIQYIMVDAACGAVAHSLETSEQSPVNCLQNHFSLSMNEKIYLRGIVGLFLVMDNLSLFCLPSHAMFLINPK